MSPWVHRSLTALGYGLTLSCVREPSPPSQTAAEAIELPRPAGVVLERPLFIPGRSERSAVSEGVLVLWTPRDRKRARTVIDEFFHAVAHENIAELSALLVADAQQLSDPSLQGTRASDFWTRRLLRVGYGDLAGRLIYSPASLRNYTADELGHLAAREPTHLSIRPEEILVRVTISDVMSGNQRRFGDVMEFALTPHHDGYKIRAIFEDFRLQ